LARFLAILITVFFTSSALAEQLVDIYRAEALVASQQANERTTAARSGLREVMIRVSGDRNAPAHPAIAAAISRGQNYLHEFSYASTDRRIESEGGSTPATLLIMKFSPQAIQTLLREAGLPLWPANRPKLMVWTIFEESEGTRNRVADPAALQAVYDQAGVRGVPLLLPQQDFEDSIALPSDALWELDQETIRTASDRYKPDAILAGRLTRLDETNWQSSWLLLQANDQQIFEGSGAGLAAQLASAIDTSSDRFARQYAIVPRSSGPDVVVLQIEDVKGFAGFKQVQQYLEDLAMVKQLDLIQVQGSSLRVRLHIEGDQSLLSSTFELGKKLYPRSSVSVGASPLSLPPEEDTDDDDADAASFDALPVAGIIGTGSEDNPLVYRWLNR